MELEETKTFSNEGYNVSKMFLKNKNEDAL
jgi:hypothetical protein